MAILLLASGAVSAPLSDIVTSVPLVGPLVGPYLAPISGLFDFPTRGYWIFGINGMTNKSGLLVPYNLGSGSIELSGSGGIAANNPLTMNVTLLLRQQYDKNLSGGHLYFRPEKAFIFPLANSQFGFHKHAVIPIYPTKLGIKYTNNSQVVFLSRYVGVGQVEYFDTGNLTLKLEFNDTHWSDTRNNSYGVFLLNRSSTTIPFIVISSSDVTVTKITNELVLSLTFLLLSLGLLELRISPKTNQRNDDKKPENPISKPVVT